MNLEEKKSEVQVLNRLESLANSLKGADRNTFFFDSEDSGVLEGQIVRAQIEVMNTIGELLEEILEATDEVVADWVKHKE